MSESMIPVRNPCGEPSVKKLQLTPRPESLRGLTVGLAYDNDMGGFDKVLKRFKTLLTERCGVADVILFDKDTDVKFARSTRPAAPALLKEMAEKCDVAIVGLGA